MREKDLYSYFLTVDGTVEERGAVYAQLSRFGVLNDKLVLSDEEPVLSHYHVDEHWGAISEWDEVELNDTLHAIAVAVPGATLLLEGNNETDRITRFQKRFHGDLYQMAGTVTEMQPLREGGDVPYAQRNNSLATQENPFSAIASLAYELYKQDWLKTHISDQSRLSSMAEYLGYVKECTEEGIPCDSYDEYLSEQGFRGTLYVCMDEFLEAEFLDQAFMVGLFKGNEFLTAAYQTALAEQGIEIDSSLRYEEQKEPIFILCEEMEDKNSIREFNILGVSSDYDALQKLMGARIEQDQYGIIAMNGVAHQSENYFSSNFEGDLIKYYIYKEKVLNRDQTLDLLHSKAFSTEFVYPDNFRICVLAAASAFAEDHKYGEVDCKAVADDLMQNKMYQAELKQTFWFEPNALSDSDAARAKNFTVAFLNEILAERPDYFSEIGAAPAFNPPSNLKDILIDCIYDVAKSYHLPVSDVYKEADSVMRNSTFRSYFTRVMPNVKDLEAGSMEQLKATTFCMAYMKDHYERMQGKPDRQVSKRFSLESLIHQAERRQSTAGKSTGVSDRER